MGSRSFGPVLTKSKSSLSSRLARKALEGLSGSFTSSLSGARSLSKISKRNKSEEENSIFELATCRFVRAMYGLKSRTKVKIKNTNLYDTLLVNSSP